MRVYFGSFVDAANVESEFEEPNALQGAEVLFAIYATAPYEGDAFVLFRRDGVLYEVNASHCSCYGLEGQWEPEQASAKELHHRLTAGTFGDYWQWQEEGVSEPKRALLAVVESLLSEVPS